jgi:hypothetical protein
LPLVTRTDLMPAGYRKPENAAKRRLLKFFSFSDVHITDKEAPNQFLLLQQTEPAASNNTSVYSPVMLYSTQVLDAAVQTVNDLHRRDPFDFGIALGDASNFPLSHRPVFSRDRSFAHPAGFRQPAKSALCFERFLSGAHASTQLQRWFDRRRFGPPNTDFP